MMSIYPNKERDVNDRAFLRFKIFDDKDDITDDVLQIQSNLKGKRYTYTLLGTHNYSNYCLPLTGGTISGGLTVKGWTTLGTGFSLVDDEGNGHKIVSAYGDGSGTNNNGCNLLLSGGGNTFVGSGEAPQNLYTEYDTNGPSLKYPIGEPFSPSGENLYLGSDGGIFFLSNCQTIGSRRMMSFGSDGLLYVNNGIRLNNGQDWNGITVYNSSNEGAKWECAHSNNANLLQFILYDTTNSTNNRRILKIKKPDTRESTPEMDCFQIGEVKDGVSSNYNIYGQHNITKQPSSQAVPTSLVDGKIVLIYE